jgi:hypothetical protein
MKNEQILESLQEKRTKCIVYTRVMGYHRPVESFNVGKTGEHQERVKFQEPCDAIAAKVSQNKNVALV